MANTSRIGAIDFWRGLVLIAILVDHIPGNGLEHATPRNFGFSDSAEGFVFLSGLSVGAIYLPRAKKYGLFTVGFACLRRALKLYVVHIAMTAAALALFIGAGWLTGLDELIFEHGRALVLENPALGASGIAVLGHQIGYFNILPLYIALMVWAPVALALTLSRPWLALIVSVALYAVARAFDLNLPNWPDDGSWFFNALAWQLPFTCGVIAATYWREAPRVQLAPVATSLAVVLGAAILVTDAFGLAEGLRAAASAHLDLGKQNLGLLRLVHFVAIAYLAAIASGIVQAKFGRFAESLRTLGRHSLPVFVIGSMLAALGQAAMTIAATKCSPAVVLGFGMTYTIVAIAVSFLLARRLDCQDLAFFPFASAVGGPSSSRARSRQEPWFGHSSAAR
jgi:hypothetical protein